MLICLGSAAEFRAWTFNDNLSGDDFISFGMGMSRQKGANEYGVEASGLTSKSLGMRYDLVQYHWSRESRSPQHSLRWALLAFQRTNLGGSWIQNHFHQSIGMGTTDLPYESPRLAGGVELENWNSLRKHLQVGFKLRISPWLVSSQWLSLLRLQGKSSALEYEAALGWRQILSRAAHYSEMERSGTTAWLSGGLHLYGPWVFEAGARYIPVQNYTSSLSRVTALPGYQCQTWMGLRFQAGLK